VYNPPVPTDFSYTDCRFNPESGAFNLLDNSDGIAFVDTAGAVAKASDQSTSLPQLTFVRAGVPGLYDLKVADGGYLAINLDGLAVLVDESSGPGYVTKGDQTYTTSLFGYDCSAKLYIGIPDVVPFELGVDSASGKLYVSWRASPELESANLPKSRTTRHLPVQSSCC
jgi:hypothetical protein